MNFIKLTVKFFLVHILTTIFLLFASVLFYSIFPGSKTFRWIVGIGYTLLYWYIIIDFGSRYGSEDAKNKNFHILKGFIAGTLSIMPVVLFYFITEWKSLPYLFLRLFLIPYDRFLQEYGETFPQLAIIVSLIFPIMSGIGYIIGLTRWRIIQKRIDNTKVEN